LTSVSIILAKTHRETSMNVISLPCRRIFWMYLMGNERDSIFPQLDVIVVMIESTVLTKCYNPTVHATGPGVRN
jgi:hypothetical protein